MNPASVREDHEVTLTCQSSPSLPRSNLTWTFDGVPLHPLTAPSVSPGAHGGMVTRSVVSVFFVFFLDFFLVLFLVLFLVVVHIHFLFFIFLSLLFLNLCYVIYLSFLGFFSLLFGVFIVFLLIFFHFSFYSARSFLFSS
ncbi:hypothetical protein E2C01_050671 [Portunus trituberculatus]|uniref:Ig-like domain-containing protein n=1 Tax=Portunus trituberculatus TaxID=210409 RepID=A0A5B7GGM0_PORTR|nr:hypothetical protein [Portunus trituberculatus]